MYTDTILIVDDDSAISETLADILSTKGFRIFIESTGQAALATCEYQAINIAFIDIRLPDMDGITLLLEMTEKFPQTACVIITGHASIQNATNSLRQGAQGYFIKPLIIDEVLHRIYAILEKQKLLIELKNSEEKYRSLLKNINIGIFRIENGLNGNILEANPAMVSMIGFKSNQELADITLAGLFINSRDKARFMTAATKDGFVKSLEFQLQVNHKVRIWVSCSAKTQYHYSKTGDKTISWIDGTLEDITERKQADEELKIHQEILQNVTEGVYMQQIDDGHIVYSNPKLEKMFAYNLGELLGQQAAILNASPAASRNNDIEDIKRCLNTSGEWHGEILSKKKDGKLFWCSVNISIYSHSRYGTVWIHVLDDITRQKQQEDLFRHSQKMNALGKLTGGIAHDYNNMLGVVLGYSQLLVTQLDKSDPGYQYAKEILHAGERGKALTRKLLSFSSHKASQRKVISINHLLKNLQDMLEKTLTARIQLRFKLQEDIWLTQLDPGDLEDAIVNMAINASHAISGDGKLLLETRNEYVADPGIYNLELKPGDYIVLTITDNGVGIDRKIINNIFDPFYTTKGKHGTGLGLSQVYGFMQRCRGDIKVKSKLKKQTKFSLFFPRDYSKVKERQESVQSALRRQCYERILVVDDEQAMLDLATTIMAKEGYKVLKAISGEQALKLLENSGPVDALLTDIIMPGMDGYELAEKVKEKYPDILIQFVTGFNASYGKQQNKLAKNIAIIEKPYTAGDLLQCIGELLDQVKLDQDAKGRTVLIMDDDEPTRELFKINLNKLGYNTLTAIDGEQAISMYQQSQEYTQEKSPGKPNRKIDVIIMDLSIPGSFGGKDAVKKILAINSKAKVIVSSGYADDPVMIDYWRYGFQGAIEKDFDIYKIKKIFNKVLSQP